MKDNNLTVTNIILFSLWIIGLLYAAVVICLIASNMEDKARALMPIGVLIAAFIASASVMKSIESSRQQHSTQLMHSRRAELIYAKSSITRLNAILSSLLETIDEDKFNTYSPGELISIRDEIVNHIKNLDSKELFVLLSDDDIQDMNIIIGYLHGTVYVLNQKVGTRTSLSRMMQQTILGKGDGKGLIDSINKVSITIENHLKTVKTTPTS